MPVNPCGGAGGGRGGGGGGGGFGGGGGNTAGPYVLPGTYNVALIVDDKTVETKPIKIVADPEIQMNDVQRKRYNDILMDLHEMQRKGTPVQQALSSIYSQMSGANGVAAKVKDLAALPAAVRTQFDAFNKEFESIRIKFGVPIPAGGGGRGGGGGGGGGAVGAAGAAGGGRGGAVGAAGAAGGAAGVAGAAAAANPENTGGFVPPQGGFGGGGGRAPGLVSEASTLKGQIMSFWELPSDALAKEYNDLKLAMPKAMLEANTFLAKVPAMSDTLKKYDVTLTAPAPTK